MRKFLLAVVVLLSACKVEVHYLQQCAELDTGWYTCNVVRRFDSKDDCNTFLQAMRIAHNNKSTFTCL